jgi:hypothetical protein
MIATLLSYMIPAGIMGYVVGTWIRLSRENNKRLG